MEHIHVVVKLTACELLCVYLVQEVPLERCPVIHLAERQVGTLFQFQWLGTKLCH